MVNMKQLFGPEEVNKGRQIEFDIAKAVCILGMVFVHCFEELTFSGSDPTGIASYIMVIVLDAIFGAATFMASMGLGIAYSWKGDADSYIKRGFKILILGYALNFLRWTIPFSIFLIPEKMTAFETIVVYGLNNDIMQFAGLALMLFGFLKKIKLSDLAITAIAVGMSVIGSFFRFVTFNSTFIDQITAMFFGITDEYEYACAYFPLFNWFIIVVCGYLYGKALRRCKDLKKYYAIALPVSAVILAVYMIIAIPNRMGLMNDDIFHYYFMTTIEVPVCLIGMIFATSVYHYISLIMSDKVKHLIYKISNNINTTYCIHWIIIGWISTFMEMETISWLSDAGVFIFGAILFVIANILAELFQRAKKKRKA